MGSFINGLFLPLSLSLLTKEASTWLHAGVQQPTLLRERGEEGVLGGGEGEVSCPHCRTTRKDRKISRGHSNAGSIKLPGYFIGKSN